jgi:ABC-type nitrate/sulfonate/bicarbonate transport system permease component
LSSKVFLAAFASTWPLLMQTLYGVQDVDPVATDTARSFGFGRAQRLARVTLPSTIPYIATGSASPRRSPSSWPSRPSW